MSPEAIEEALAASGRNFEDSDSEDDDTTSMSLMEESSDSEAATELAIFQVKFPKINREVNPRRARSASSVYLKRVGRRW